MSRYSVFITSACMLLGSVAVCLGEVSWSNDYTETLKRSEETGKPAFVYFSGSNWCGFCKRFDAQIEESKELQSYLKENFELVNLDFPRPSPKDDPNFELNTWLKAQHAVTGFPAILILDHRGAVLARSGYKRDGAEAFIKDLKKQLSEGEDSELTIPDV